MIREVLWFVEMLQLVSHLSVTFSTVIHLRGLMCIPRFQLFFHGSNKPSEMLSDFMENKKLKFFFFLNSPINLLSIKVFNVCNLPEHPNV